MPDPVMLTWRERQTLIAALRFWCEEIVPSPEMQLSYFDSPEAEPLSEREIDELSARLARP